jgi:hypothetical protein
MIPAAKRPAVSQEARALAYLHDNRAVMDELRARSMNQNRLSREIGVSPPTLSRVLRKLGLRIPKLPPPTQDTLIKLKPLLEDPAKIETDGTLIAYVMWRALSEVIEGYSIERRAQIRRRMKRKDSSVLIHLHPDVYELLDRRGGNRRQAGAF